MAGKVVGHKETVMEVSFQNPNNGEWMHLARYFRHDLHSTKGWRRAGTHKIMTKIHEKYKVTRMRITEKFEPQYKARNNPHFEGRPLQVRP